MGRTYNVIEHRIDSSGRMKPRWVTIDAASGERKQRKKRTRDKMITIGLWGATVTIPMVFLPVLLLCLIFARSTTNEPSSMSDFSFSADETANPSDSYYVKMNATTLLTVSAWSSTLTPLLGVVLMYLWSYRAAANIYKHSQTEKKSGLPSPYQFTLILEMIRGNVTSLLQDVKYMFQWRNRKTALVSLLKSSMLMLITVAVLGLLILVADTWLHLETEVVTISKSLRLISTEDPFKDRRITAFTADPDERHDLRSMEYALNLSSFYHSGTYLTPYTMEPGYWSTKLSLDCNENENYVNSLPCSLTQDGGSYLLSSLETVSQFLSNSSQSYMPQTARFDGAGKNSTMVFIVPTKTRQSNDFSTDFTAYTYGATTGCATMQHQCDMALSKALKLSVRCNRAGSTFAYSGVISNQSSVLENHTLYSDPSYSKLVPWNVIDPEDYEKTGFYPTQNMVNPSYPAVAMASLNLYSPNFPGYSFLDHTGIGTVMFCKHTIWDVNYTFTNNSWTIRGATPSNTHVANVTNTPLMLGSLQSYFNFHVDDVMNTEDEQEQANRYATAYSLASMAILAANVQSAPFTSAQVRHRVLVTRVPKAPLFCLMALNLIYALFGLALTLDALLAVRKNKNLIDVQARLGMAGLTAECFEKNDAVERKVDAGEDLFAEKKGCLGVKIGLRRASKGISGDDPDEEDGEPRGWRLSRYDIEEVEEKVWKRRDIGRS